MRLVKRTMAVTVTLVVSALLMAGCGGAQSAEESQASGQTSEQQPETLRLAVTDLVGLEELQRNFEPFQEELSNILGMEVELFPVSDRTAAVAALEADRVDMVLTGPAEYVVMRARTDAVPVIGITRPGYRSVIAVQADSELQQLQELEGATMAMSDVGSTSGHLGPSVILQNAGIDPQSDLEVSMLGDNDLPAFARGETQAWGGAALDLENFIQESEDLSQGDVRVIAEGPPLPNDVFVARPDLPDVFIENVRTSMQENEDALIQAILSGEANEKYEGAELTNVENSDYDYMRDAYRAVGVDDFSEFVE